MARRGTKPKGPKKLAYKLIDDVAGESGRPMYDLLRGLVRDYREDLKDARIALAYCTSWKEDVDGRLTLGKCKKASDLDRELMAFDFVILLNRTFWNDPEVTDVQRRALLDHELMHAAVKYDDAGEPVEDERGRLVYRTRKHDIEEFADTVKRHGIYRHDLEHFAHTLRQAALAGFKPCDGCKSQGTPGWVTIETEGGSSRLTRCKCFLTHRARLDPDAPPPPLTQALPLGTPSPSTH